MKFRGVTGIAALLAATLALPASGVVRVQNFARSIITAESSVHVSGYGAGRSKLFDVATDWDTGTYLNTTKNSSGDVVLAPGGTGYATSGTWTSPVIDSGGTGAAAVYGTLRATSSLETNVALGKTATQSSTGFSGIASFGNDGNTSGVYGYAAGSVFHTNNGNNEWWQVDLGANYTVSSVRLWNRTDCCNTRASNLWVTLSTTPYTGNLTSNLVSGIPQGQAVGVVGTPSVVTLSSTATGRYLRVWQPIREYLHLAEVEVIGAASTSSTTGISYKFASSTSATGPWTYVGPDGTAATSFTDTITAIPYAADGSRYFRIQATFTGPGSSTPVLGNLTAVYALTELSRTSGSTFATTPEATKPTWIARIKTDNTTLLGLPSLVRLGTGSVWAAHSATFSTDSPADQCCSSPHVTVTAGSAVDNSVTGTNTFPAGAGSGLSVIAQRTTTGAATANLNVQIKPAGGLVVEVPLSISLT